MHLVYVPDQSAFSLRIEGVVAELARELDDDVFGVDARVLLLYLQPLSANPQLRIDLA